MSMIEKRLRLILMGSLLLATGCGGAGKAVYKIGAEPRAKYASKGKLPYDVAIMLDDNLCNTNWYIPIGLPFYADIGESFCKNAVLFSESTFAKTTTATSTGEVEGDWLFLRPKLIQIKKETGVYSFDTNRVTVFVKWTLADRGGNILWTDVVDGTGSGEMGGPFSYKSNSVEQIEEAISKVFTRTNELMSRIGQGLIDNSHSNIHYEWIQAQHYDSAEAYENFMEKNPDSRFIEDAVGLHFWALVRFRFKTNFCDELATVHARAGQRTGSSYTKVQEKIGRSLSVLENSLASPWGTYATSVGTFTYSGGTLTACSVAPSSGCKRNLRCTSGVERPLVTRYDGKRNEGGVDLKERPPWLSFPEDRSGGLFLSSSGSAFQVDGLDFAFAPGPEPGNSFQFKIIGSNKIEYHGGGGCVTDLSSGDRICLSLKTQDDFGLVQDSKYYIGSALIVVKDGSIVLEQNVQ